jgi:hypothetical protein
VDLSPATIAAGSIAIAVLEQPAINSQHPARSSAATLPSFRGAGVGHRIGARIAAVFIDSVNTMGIMGNVRVRKSENVYTVYDM